MHERAAGQALGANADRDALGRRRCGVCGPGVACRTRPLAGLHGRCRCQRRLPRRGPARRPHGCELSSGERRLFPRHGQRRRAQLRTRSRAETCGSSGLAAMIGSGIEWSRTAWPLSISSRSSRPIQVRPIATASSAIATRAGIGLAPSMNPASRSRQGLILSTSAFGLTCRDANCPPDPFEDAAKYPGCQDGPARHSLTKMA